MTRRIPLVLILVLITATRSIDAAGKSPVCDEGCGFCPAVESPGGHLLITPAGNGTTLAERSATVVVQLKCGGVPVPFYPFQDIWLGTGNGMKISLCQEPLQADSNTDSDGMTIVSGTIVGGGWTLDSLKLFVAGTEQPGDLGIVVNSPDINGDLAVNLLDAGIFAQDFRNGSYDFRSDLQYDGVENLADISILASHIGESCH